MGYDGQRCLGAGASRAPHLSLAEVCARSRARAALDRPKILYYKISITFYRNAGNILPGVMDVS